MFVFRCRAFAVIALSALLAGFACAQSTLISLPTRRDMVFDHAGNYLYISTSDGWLQRYNVAAAQLEPGYNLGGSPIGIDIAPDDSFMLVAQGPTTVSHGTVQRVQLSTGQYTNLNYTLASDEGGAWDISIASNNIAFFTTGALGSWVPLRQIDLTTNVITTRADVPESSGPAGLIRERTNIDRSADGTRLYLRDLKVFTYNAATNTFGPRGGSGGGTAAVNRIGSVVATSISGQVSVDTVPSFDYLHTFSKVNSGVAFDAVRDRFYGVASATAQIIAYDAKTFAELYRLSIGENIVPGAIPFSTGMLVASGDGRFLALATTSGIRIFTLPTEPLPPPTQPTFGTPRDIIFDHAGHRLYITTAEGLLWPYDLTAGLLEPPIDVGGFPWAVDIASDDSFLIMAQGGYGVSQGAFQKVDLTTSVVTNFNYTRGSSGGSWDVAIGSSERALGITVELGSGFAPLREINFSSGTISTRTDVPGGGNLTQASQIHRSADGTRMYLLDGNFPGRAFTYSTVSDTFGPRIDRNTVTTSASAAVSRTGFLLATRLFNPGASLETAANFGFVQSFITLAGGVAFDAVSDTLYGVSPYLSQIIAYDTNTFAERFRFDIGEPFASGATQFGRGLLVASHDGRYLALNTGTAVRIYGVPAVQLVSVDSVKSHSGQEFTVNLPLDGPRAVESRSGGANGVHTLVVTFGNNLADVAAASVTSGTGTVASSSIDSGDSRRYVVNLSGVTNRQTVKVTLSGVTDAAGNHTDLISAQMGVLLGDTNGNGTVNASDIGETKAQSGHSPTAANFRADVNASGAINATDIGIVKSQAGMTLPLASDPLGKQ